MKRTHCLSITIVILSTLTGCSSYRVSEVTSTRKDRENTWFSGGLGRQMINPEKYKGSQTNSLYVIASDPKDPEKARMARNELQDKIITISDQEVAAHLSRITGSQINVNILLGAAALGTAGAAAIADPEAAKVLAQIATGLVGAKSLFNEEVYRNALAPVLVASITSKRNELRAQMHDVMQSKPISEYSVSRAVQDANEFHHRGSFYYGLTLITEEMNRTNMERSRTNDLMRTLAGQKILEEQKLALKQAEVATAAVSKPIASVSETNRKWGQLVRAIREGANTAPLRVTLVQWLYNSVPPIGSYKANYDSKFKDADNKVLPPDKLADRLAEALELYLNSVGSTQPELDALEKLRALLQ